MKLKEYALHIKVLAEKYPNLKVIHSSDDEGNSFGLVMFAPTLGKFNGRDFEIGEKKPNAVCVN